tara:strand:- start:3942 stop:4730 length:789 start_codon:yes stop_codon:yes gene_type:complete
MQNKPIIEIDSLNYIANKKTIIKNISFDIYEKDFISIVGPNGSGKSTLIRLISGDLEPISGNINIMGKDKSDWNIFDLAKYRAVLPQFNHLSFPFSVLDVVKMGRYPLRHKDNSKEENKIYEKLFDIFDLNGVSNQIYTTLSGGEKQRVQLARVISQIWSTSSYKNKILILDEPTSYLDIKHQMSLFKFLKSLNERGLTIMLVVHDINQAILNTQKIILLKHAELIAYGENEKIINNELLSKVFDVPFNLENLKKRIKFSEI